MNSHYENRDFDQHLFSSDQKVVFAHDLTGNFTFLNHAGELILGYSCEEARRMNVVDLIQPESAALIQEQIAGISTKRIGAVYEIEIIAKDGHRIPLEVSMRLVSRRGQHVEIEGIAVPSTLHVDARAKTPQCLDENFCNTI